jgi:hypothetical protein
MQPDFSQIGPLLIAVLVVFTVSRRLRRSFGRQPLRPRRMTVRIVLLTVIGCALMPAALRSAQFLSAELAGVAIGIALGLWGAERTRFLMAGERLHYVPHTYTGIAVSALFLGRLAFRLVQMYSGSRPSHVAYANAVPGADPAQPFAAGSMIQSPLTVGILYVLIGYYVCYYGLVLWKSKHLKAEDIESDPASAATLP